MIYTIILAVIIIAFIYALFEVIQGYHNHIVDLQEQWQQERASLLDRIQAPDFAQYKNAEIKMVKAQQTEEPKPSFILE